MLELYPRSPVPKMTVLCRLCAVESSDTINIFSDKGLELCLSEKINKCLPVVVSGDHFVTRYLKHMS